MEHLPACKVLRNFLISIFHNAGITITNSFTVDFGNIFQIDKHLSIKLKIISCLFVLVVQNNYLLEKALLSAHNIYFGTEIRKMIVNYALLSGGLISLIRMRSNILAKTGSGNCQRRYKNIMALQSVVRLGSGPSHHCHPD